MPLRQPEQPADPYMPADMGDMTADMMSSNATRRHGRYDC